MVTVVSHEAKEEAASKHPNWTQDSLRVSIYMKELGNSKMPQLRSLNRYCYVLLDNNRAQMNSDFCV